ncbi:MAG: prolyl oligopeptidase family serine peptidase [Planctomycetaceae bacterium]
MRCTICALLTSICISSSASGQISEPDRTELESQLKVLDAELKQAKGQLSDQQFGDIAICTKAVQWALRHNEFPKPSYVGQTKRVLKLATERLQAATSKSTESVDRSIVRAYRSAVDGSLQPYCISFPEGFDSESTKSIPLYVKLHGRANAMNEVNFFHRHHGKPPAKDQTWIQLDVYGRGNNAYRWAGETDVFEGIADVKRRHYIDENRITLHGFSMGGAGAWHLGLHHPHLWSSVGAGAGFIDFYKYQNQTEQRPIHEHRTLGIYDAIDYALNASNVPVCAYGGEKDAQLAAGQSMFDASKELGFDLKLIVGPNMGHKFDPKSLAEFMAFHKDYSAKGRPKFGERDRIRFTTRTLKYNRCDWLVVEETKVPYAKTVVEAKINDNGTIVIETTNVRVLRLARGIATNVEIDGVSLPFDSAADGLLPDVFYQQDKDGDWSVLDYENSKAFPDNNQLHKREGLQGPIDDAFTQSFICVKPTGKPQSPNLHNWSIWTMNRFASEWNKWMRGELPAITDKQLTAKMIRDKNLVLFGDPSSNSIIAKVLADLPIDWTKDNIIVKGNRYSTDEHGISLIFPNPLNPKRYVVINSGHTFHERDFKASNSWLFPRLGDGAVLKINSNAKDGFDENVESAWIFDSNWKLPKTN